MKAIVKLIVMIFLLFLGYSKLEAVVLGWDSGSGQVCVGADTMYWEAYKYQATDSCCVTEIIAYTKNLQVRTTMLTQESMLMMGIIPLG